MKRIILTLVIPFFIFTAGYTQQTNPEQAETTKQSEADVIAAEGNVYQEIVVEDFENVDFKDSNIVFQKSRDEEYKVAIREEFPAPINNSKKYLGVKLRGTKSNAIQIKFPQDKIPAIEKYCQSISIWVYGKRFSGELSMFIMDGEGNTHRLSFGKLNFHGWYKLTKILTPDIAQMDMFLEKKSNIKILSLLYIPGTWYKFATNVIDPAWQTFYIDDITAKVREKYQDSQNDEW